MCALARTRGCEIGLCWLVVLGLHRAISRKSFAQRGDPQHGRELFERVWTPGLMPAGGDGLGPMFNRRSCVACHFLGGVGGAGPNQHNVDLITALRRRMRPITSGRCPQRMRVIVGGTAWGSFIQGSLASPA